MEALFLIFNVITTIVGILSGICGIAVMGAAFYTIKEKPAKVLVIIAAIGWISIGMTLANLLG